MITGKSNKVLSVFGLAMINVIAIDSLRNLPVNASYGSQVIVLYLLGALCFLIPCCLMTAMLATKYPKTGGSYIWVEQAFGRRWGFVAIWMLWIYNVVWFPTLLSFIAANIAYLFDPALSANKAFIVPVVVVTFLLATLVNNRGIRFASRFSSVGAIVGTLIPLILIIGLGVWWVLAGKPLAIDFQLRSLVPHVSHVGNLSFITIIIFSLMGIEMSAIHAGDVKNPRKDFPRALLLSCVLILGSCVLASLAIALVVPKGNLSFVGGLDQALFTFLDSRNLHWLFIVAVIMILIGSFAGMAAWTLGPARGVMVAAQEGCAPAFFAKTNTKGAPSQMLYVQLVVVVLLALFFLFFKKFNAIYITLGILSSQLALLYYILFFAAGLKLGLTPTNSHYRIPFGKFGLWLVGVLGLLTCVVVILLGFLPSNEIQGISVLRYELILLIGIALFITPPFIIYRLTRQQRTG